MEEESTSILVLGCFMMSVCGDWTTTVEENDIRKEQGEEFRPYVWGEKGITNRLKLLERKITALI